MGREVAHTGRSRDPGPYEDLVLRATDWAGEQLYAVFIKQGDIRYTNADLAPGLWELNLGQVRLALPEEWEKA